MAAVIYKIIYNIVAVYVKIHNIKNIRLLFK